MADALQAAHRQHDLAAGLVRDLPANEPGVARLQDDADAGLVREREDARDLLGAAGPQHERRAADVAVAPFAQVGELLVGVGDGVRGPTISPRRAMSSGVGAASGGVASFGIAGLTPLEPSDAVRRRGANDR